MNSTNDQCKFLENRLNVIPKPLRLRSGMSISCRGLVRTIAIFSMPIRNPRDLYQPLLALSNIFTLNSISDLDLKDFYLHVGLEGAPDRESIGHAY